MIWGFLFALVLPFGFVAGKSISGNNNSTREPKQMTSYQGNGEGEACGSCFCPPTFTAGECEVGLVCIPGDPMLPDAPGTCQRRLTGKSCVDGTKVWADGESGTCSDGCNRCSCRDGELESTRMACKKKGKSCIDGDKIWADGEGGTCSDGCNECSCHNGQLMSTLMACPNIGKSCIDGDKIWADGEGGTCSDGCNVCSCHNGQLMSTLMACHNIGNSEGEDCGSCFCPPTFTAGECEEGLVCVPYHDPRISDAPGTCQRPSTGPIRPPGPGGRGSCRCDGFVGWNGGVQVGECQTRSQGRRFCYVDRNFGCADQKPSNFFNERFWSYDACQRQPRSTEKVDEENTEVDP